MYGWCTHVGVTPCMDGVPMYSTCTIHYTVCMCISIEICWPELSSGKYLVEIFGSAFYTYVCTV